MKLVGLYLILINVFAFVLYGIDKIKAKKQRWRVPEIALFFVALIGGSVGALLGMGIFRHKTQHLKFKIGILVILLAQIILAIFLYRTGIFQ